MKKKKRRIKKAKKIKKTAHKRNPPSLKLRRTSLAKIKFCGLAATEPWRSWVPGTGIEPVQGGKAPQDFKSCVSTNSTTRAEEILKKGR